MTTPAIATAPAERAPVSYTPKHLADRILQSRSAFESTLNQYTGDGIMAPFGAPIAHEDHAQRACYAALHMREALRAFSRARGMKVYEARPTANGRNIALLPILELFRACFGITPQDDDRTARERIAGRMVLLDAAFADALPLLFDVIIVASSAGRDWRTREEQRVSALHAACA